MLFPTAPTLERLQQLAERKPKLLIIINPQVGRPAAGGRRQAAGGRRAARGAV